MELNLQEFNKLLKSFNEKAVAAQFDEMELAHYLINNSAKKFIFDEFEPSRVGWMVTGINDSIEQFAFATGLTTSIQRELYSKTKELVCFIDMKYYHTRFGS